MSKAFYNIVNFIILTAVLVVVFYITNQKYIEVSQPCSEPLGYAIGEVDDRFGLSRPQVFRALAQAENIWESATNTDMFRYVPDAELKVHMRFDDRQAETLKIKEIENELSQKDDVYNALKAEVDAVKKSFEEVAAQYESMELNYRSELEKYNREVQAINDDGGASEKQAKELTQKRESLEQQVTTLETKRQEVNAIVSQQREKVEELNVLAQTLNTKVEDFNESYGVEKVFDQGRFDGKEIIVYQYTEIDDLILVLAHELGHARGLGHVDNPESVMHAIFHGDSEKQNSITADDLAELEKACNPDISLWNLKMSTQE